MTFSALLLAVLFVSVMENDAQHMMVLPYFPFHGVYVETGMGAQHPLSIDDGITDPLKKSRGGGKSKRKAPNYYTRFGKQMSKFNIN